MRKFGVLFACMFLAAPMVADAQEPFPDPPILVNTPTGTVPITIPRATVPAQAYDAGAAAQPIVVPVPINMYVTPNMVQRPTQIVVPAPQPVVIQQQAPAFPPQPPQPPANQACLPIDGRTPLPFEPPMDGPVRSTVLTPAGYQAQMQQQQAYTQPNPFAGAPAGQPTFGQTYFAPQPPQIPTEQLSVPAPGVPYSLDAQGRPQYVQQPGAYQRPSPQQWPGYTPVPYPQMPPQQQPQPGYQQQMGYQAGQPYPAPAPAQVDQSQYIQQVPANLNPNLNPNLTNPNTPVQLVTPAQVQQALRENAQMIVLDVRGELVRDVIGHIPNDTHVSLSPSESFPARVRNAIPNTGLPVVVYCNDGINSSQAANMMANMGYKVYLMGIYTGWAHGAIPAQACTSCQ